MRTFNIWAAGKVYLSKGGDADFDCPVLESQPELVKKSASLKDICVFLGTLTPKFRKDSFDLERHNNIHIVMESPTATIYLDIEAPEDKGFSKSEQLTLLQALGG